MRWSWINAGNTWSRVGPNRSPFGLGTLGCRMRGLESFMYYRILECVR